ncbi:MAG: hypothetical protein R3207_09570 [Oceanospirillum sp.]|nr:hypothetical protein [Oceanospirillum sp.]
MSERIKKIQKQKAKPMQDKVVESQKLECNYKDDYYGDKTCVPCGK